MQPTAPCSHPSRPRKRGNDVKRWWIRHRLRMCGCTLCLSHLVEMERIWAAETLFARALWEDPIHIGCAQAIGEIADSGHNLGASLTGNRAKP